MRKKIFVIFFICIISMPSVAMLLGIRQIHPIDENRIKRNFPQDGIITMFVDDGEYATKITKYFNDNFFLRDMMIRLKNEIQFKVFGVSGEDGLYISKNGYMFYKSVIEQQQIKNEKISDERQEELIDALRRVHGYLKSKNIEFLVMVPPQKNDIMLGELEKTNVNRPEPNRYQRLCETLRNDADLKECFIDIYPVLLETEKVYPTFYKTDFHWNSIGSTVAFTQVINDLARKSGYDYDIFGPDNYNIYTLEGFKGGQISNVPLLVDPSETVESVMSNGTVFSEIVDDGMPNSALHYKGNEDFELGNILIVGDSYTGYMLAANAGIQEKFKNIYYVHVMESENVLDNYMGMVDYVLFERVENFILTDDNYIINMSTEL